MAATTTVLGMPYPEGSDANDVPADIQALAERLDEAPGIEQPEALASVHMWRIAADIAAAYAYAVATDLPNPGKDEAVVTDAAILAAVTAILTPAPANVGG